jgi:hypothetical protein
MGNPPKKYVKPEVADVYEFLRRYDALIIHFSGPKGDELRAERFFPTDLKNVIAGGALGGVSSCVIGPRDDFDNCSWGSIGVVLGFRNKDSLVAADAHDCGSREETIGGKIVRTVQREKDLCVNDLETTITQRTSYNEWVVRCYEVLGIFAHPPCIADVAGESRHIHYQELLAWFPKQPILSFKDGLIYRLGPNRPIAHSEIYRAPPRGPEFA